MKNLVVLSGPAETYDIPEDDDNTTGYVVPFEDIDLGEWENKLTMDAYLKQAVSIRALP